MTTSTGPSFITQVAIIALGLVLVLGLIGIVVLAADGTDIPDSLKMVETGALGALAGVISTKST